MGHLSAKRFLTLDEGLSVYTDYVNKTVKEGGTRWRLKR